jgi:hypothetical protein
MSQDDYGFLGPNYSVPDAIPLPGQVGVRQEASFGAILDSIGGVNYYVDTIAFGGPTFFDSHNPQPMGIRYYLNTGMRCSNGATMSEYFDGITKGDILGSRVAAGLASAGLPGLRGLAPGILENARDALDPRPIFSAVTATGYPVCQQVACPVGDNGGAVTDPADPTQTPFILGDLIWNNGMPYQKRWVQSYDANGEALSISKDEFAAAPKCYNADGSYMDNPGAGCAATEPPAVADPGIGRYSNCSVLQPPSLPGGAAEGFSGISDVSEGGVAAAALITGVALLGGLALWSMSRK